MSPTPRRTPPGPGQRSVWDHPRPPRLERCPERVRVLAGDTVLADTTSAWRVLETSHPPVYYLPPRDVRMDLLPQGAGASRCEWKGEAAYFDLELPGSSLPRVAWSYPDPSTPYEPIAGHLAFYLRDGLVGLVGEERAQPQPGGFYGGWVTAAYAGPFKGEPGSAGW